MPPKKRTAHEISEELLKIAGRPDADRDRLSLLHEVRVYQEEITVQNEELLRAQQSLEETRDQFVDLYDFAPNGYLTLDEHGLILRINLTGAAMLGRARQAIEGLPLLGFLDSPQRPTLVDFMRRCRSRTATAGETVDLTLVSFDGPRHIQLLCRPRNVNRDGHREFFTAIVDVTERRQLERARELAAHERAALARRLIAVQEDERKRIARDLHDNIGQQITALRLHLETLEQKAGDDANRSGFREVLEGLRVLDRSVDFISSELRPASLDLGFMTAVRQFVRHWSATFGIPADLTSEHLDTVRLRPEVETHVYRVVQEALHNVYKHASSSHVRVALERDGSRLIVMVQDSGRGFDMLSTTEASRRGMGLASMRERAEIVGGVLHVMSAPGEGTMVSLIVPDAIDAPPRTGG